MKTWTDLRPDERIKLLARETLRISVSVGVLLLLYYILPFDHLSSVSAVLYLLFGLAGLVIALAVAVKEVLKADYPAIRALEELAVVVPLFLLLFATMYYLMDRADPQSFTQHMSRTASLYFTLTTFSTVGFGDITAKTDGARIAVMVQIVADLIVLGVGIKVLTGAVQMGRHLRATPGDGSTTAP